MAAVSVATRVSTVTDDSTVMVGVPRPKALAGCPVMDARAAIALLPASVIPELSVITPSWHGW